MRTSPFVPYTMYAMEATEHAQQRGQLDAFHVAAYKAYWEDGKDLGDLAVIQRLTLDCGLDWAELSELLESGYYRDTVLAKYQQAASLGITAVPAFLIGNQPLVGAQPYEMFELALVRATQSLPL